MHSEPLPNNRSKESPLRPLHRCGRCKTRGKTCNGRKIRPLLTVAPTVAAHRRKQVLYDTLTEAGYTLHFPFGHAEGWFRLPVPDAAQRVIALAILKRCRVQNVEVFVADEWQGSLAVHSHGPLPADLRELVKANKLVLFLYLMMPATKKQLARLGRIDSRKPSPGYTRADAPGAAFARRCRPRRQHPPGTSCLVSITRRDGTTAPHPTVSSRHLPSSSTSWACLGAPTPPDDLDSREASIAIDKLLNDKRTEARLYADNPLNDFCSDDLCFDPFVQE